MQLRDARAPEGAVRGAELREGRQERRLEVGERKRVELLHVHADRVLEHDPEELAVAGLDALERERGLVLVDLERRDLCFSNLRIFFSKLPLLSISPRLSDFLRFRKETC